MDTLFEVRLTLAAVTPGFVSNARSTPLMHPAQWMKGKDNMISSPHEFLVASDCAIGAAAQPGHADVCTAKLIQ
jgi:hypothetical protein